MGCALRASGPLADRGDHEYTATPLPAWFNGGAFGPHSFTPGVMVGGRSALRPAVPRPFGRITVSWAGRPRRALSGGRAPRPSSGRCARARRGCPGRRRPCTRRARRGAGCPPCLRTVRGSRRRHHLRRLRRQVHRLRDGLHEPPERVGRAGDPGGAFRRWHVGAEPGQQFGRRPAHRRQLHRVERGDGHTLASGRRRWPEPSPSPAGSARPSSRAMLSTLGESVPWCFARKPDGSPTRSLSLLSVTNMQPPLRT
jgi:hypothetical protein